jgi:hypothetical protein
MTDWIPVTDRLPDKDGPYLVTISGRYGHPDKVMISLYFRNLWWPDGETGWNLNGVIAWMPLPEPYQPPASGGP